MEDRYLFKAKDCNSIWRAGLLIGLQEGRCAIEEKDGSKWACNSKTICQCTGLKDENGNLIWENDIVRFQFDNDDCPFPNKDIKKRIGKVFFSDFRASWSIAMGINGSKCLNNDLFRYVQNGNRVEAISNVFDNPGLLNE